MFITFEGIDGCGKSTQIDLLKNRLEQLGALVKVFREPGGEMLSERIRDILLHPQYEIDPFSEMLLFSAARAQLVSKRIKPALKENQIVICAIIKNSTL